MSSVGNSLGSMCQAIDSLGDAAATDILRFDCCSNPDTLQTRCEQRQTINTLGGELVYGISINDGTPGTCLSTDARCNVAAGSK